MKKERVVPKKNYFYLLLMIIGVVAITFIIFGINDKYQNKKLESSYLSGYVNQIRVEEIDNILTEPNSDMFVLVTKTDDDNTPIEGVKFNILLRVISLKMNKITLKNCLEIIANISKNDNIKEIYLDDNPIVSRSDLDMLNKALQGNGTRKKK